jgi:DNA-binding beta-propeller fold protein YncE
MVVVVGCQRPPGPIFPEVSPPIEWPPRPDQPRIRYVGELRGESSLGIQATGWPAFQEVLAGPRAQVEFSRPAAVAVVGDRVFVADTGLGVVHWLDLERRQYKVIRGSPNDPLRVPIGLAVGDGRLVVADRGRASVDVFDIEGQWRRTQRWLEIGAPVAVAWDAAQGTFWLADAASHTCWATADLLNLRQRLGKGGGGPGQFNHPTALAWHPTTGLVVADAMNFRVQLFDAAGQMAGVFGQKGDAAGDFSLPRGVAVDSAGHIYVLDSQFENVQIFDRDGRLLMAFGEGGGGRGQFSVPSGIAIDERDRIWVADGYNHRVQVFQYLSEKASCAN